MYFIVFYGVSFFLRVVLISNEKSIVGRREYLLFNLNLRLLKDNSYLQLFWKTKLTYFG
ncbi:hypothetical protein RND81_03G006900 [Saponaria officinalis]|uniref:Uncharacterized protein n=1 Tax=Saponaria officinalis TaxID=3572 RepID=A0AAW1M2H7_SAPOF